MSRARSILILRRFRPSAAHALREILTERVTIANPFDIHTYLWFDPPALGPRVLRGACSAGYDAVGFMLDFPPEDKADTTAFDAAIDVFIAAARAAPAARGADRIAPRNHQRARCASAAWTAASFRLQGQREALEALGLAGAVGRAWRAGTGRAAATPARARRRRARGCLERARRQDGPGRFGVRSRAARSRRPARRRSAPQSSDFRSSSRPSVPTWSTRPKSAASFSTSQRRRGGGRGAAPRARCRIRCWSRR